MNTQFASTDDLVPITAVCFAIQYLFCKYPECCGSQVKGNMFCFEFELEVCKYPVPKPGITNAKTPLGVISC